MEAGVRTKLMERLWERLSATYAQKWRSLFKEDRDIDAWHAAWTPVIARLDRYDIARGLEDMLFEYPEWPPTLPQFAALCKPKPKPTVMLPAPKIERTPEELAALTKAAKINDSMFPYWRTDRVVNKSQVEHILRQAKHFGRESAAGRFASECMRLGVIVDGAYAGGVNKQTGEIHAGDSGKFQA